MLKPSRRALRRMNPLGRCQRSGPTMAGTTRLATRLRRGQPPSRTLSRTARLGVAPLDRASFGPRAVAVAEIDREGSLAAEGDGGGVVDLEEVERGRRPSVALWPAGNAAT
jgi:hypothetical protein